MSLTTWEIRPDRGQRTIINGTSYPASVVHCHKFPNEIWPFSIWYDGQGANGASAFSAGGLEQVLFERLASYVGSHFKPGSINHSRDIVVL